MKLSAKFDYQTVDHEKDNTVHLLLTVEAPAIDWVAQRPRICILPVIDISGSMGQENKLEYAKRACRKLVEQLKVGDYSGLVVFDHRVTPKVKPGPVTPEFKTRLLKAIDELKPEGSTNFSDTIVDSLDLLTKLDLPTDILQRLIFFTDGQPNAGISDFAALRKLVAEQVGTRSISFFGYGTGSGCNQGLLTELSQAAKGNYAYVASPDDALGAFGKELGGLLSTCASDLRLVVEPRNGHTIEKVVTLLGGEQSATDLTELSIELGDILAEETRHVVLECKVAKQDKALPRDFTLFNVKATWRRIMQTGDKAPEEATAAARLRFVRPDDAQREPTAEVDEVVSLHQLAQQQRLADEEARKGNYVAASAKLAEMAGELKTRGRIAAANVATNMARGMATPLSYRSSEGYRVSIERGIMRSSGTSSMDSMAEHDLGNLWGAGSIVGNSAQAAYSAAFTGAQVAGCPDIKPLEGRIIEQPEPLLVNLVVPPPEQPVVPTQVGGEEKPASPGK
jgi:Ca-activated chloride channel family protein